MSRLLAANFARLFKSFMFWLCIVFSVGLSIFFILMRYIDIQKNAEIYAKLSDSYKSTDGMLFIGGLFLMFAAAVLTGVFVGTEYSDGTIRNKIIIGHSRPVIYLANLIVCTTANVLMNLLSIGTALLFGEIFLINIIPVKDILLFSAVSCLTMIALSALFLLFSMLIQSKAIASITVLILSIVMFFSTMTIMNSLTAPEYYEGYTFTSTNEQGEVVEETVEPHKNPHYPTGLKRKIYVFLNDFIPSSQFYQIMSGSSDNLGKMSVYSVCILVAATGIGICAFRKKDLK